MARLSPNFNDVIQWESKRFETFLPELSSEVYIKKYLSSLLMLNEFFFFWFQDIVKMVERLQIEMSEEQTDFDALKSELESESDEHRSDEIRKLMTESQDRLAALMNKMSLCFQQKVINRLSCEFMGVMLVRS